MKKTLALLLVLVLATAAVTYAQRRRGGGRGGGGVGVAPPRPNASSFNGDFTFCRLAYQPAYDGDGGGWGVDYPRADQNLSIRLSELTKSPVNYDERREPNFYVVIPSDPELYQCPIVMMSEFGA